MFTQTSEMQCLGFKSRSMKTKVAPGARGFMVTVGRRHTSLRVKLHPVKTFAFDIDYGSTIFGHQEAESLCSGD